MAPRRIRRSFLSACLGSALACALVAPASASPGQETILQDDPKIVFHHDERALDRTLLRVKALGVDRIRVSLFWHLIAPDVRSETEPDFGEDGPEWPGSYPQAGWERYDRIVRLAAKHRIGVLMSATGPAPAWAAGGRRGREGPHRPNAQAFGQFVRAAGRRYSGTYRAGGQRVPRVGHWSIWNEPNFPAWLSPQWRRKRRRASRPVTPSLYRPIVDAAWNGLVSSGHAGDVILLGETAPYGPHNPKYPKVNALLGPLEFTRELYCLNRSYQPFRGAAARVRRCPATAEGRQRFIADHPALFQASGWAHHAYSLKRKPTFPGRRVGGAPLGAINRLVRTLDRSQRRWGSPQGWSLWLTEYGYQTFPPDPFRGVSWRRQALWMSWAEFIAYRNPRMAAFAQFLLVDDAPRRRFRYRDQRRWITWQSGFITIGGRIKPAYEEFKRPIHLSPRRPRRGRATRLFAVYRPPEDGSRLEARIQFLRRGGEWQTLTTLSVTNPRGYLDTRVRPPGRGHLRVSWTDLETGQEASSRAVFVSFRR